MEIGDESESTTPSSGQVKTTNTSDLSKIECKQIIDDMSNEIYNLRVSLKSLTKEKVRIKGSNELLSERNNKLESELLVLESLRKEVSVAKEELLVVLKEKKLYKKQIYTTRKSGLDIAVLVEKQFGFFAIRYVWMHIKQIEPVQFLGI